GGIEPLSDLAIGDFQRTGTRHRRVELGGEARAVGAERVQLGVERLLAAVGLVPPLDFGRARIECNGRTFAGRVGGAGLGHSRQPPVAGRYGPDSTAGRRKNLLRRQAVTKRSLRCVWACRQRWTAIHRYPCEWRARPMPAFFDSPRPRARASPEQPRLAQR